MYKNMSLFARRIYTFHPFYSRSMVELTKLLIWIFVYISYNTCQQTFNDVGNEKVYMGDDWKGETSKDRKLTGEKIRITKRWCIGTQRVDKGEVFEHCDFVR